MRKMKEVNHEFIPMMQGVVGAMVSMAIGIQLLDSLRHGEQCLFIEKVATVRGLV